jgi:hypothetical protein
MFGCVDSWLLYKLTGNHMTEVGCLSQLNSFLTQSTWSNWHRLLLKALDLCSNQIGVTSVMSHDRRQDMNHIFAKIYSVYKQFITYNHTLIFKKTWLPTHSRGRGSQYGTVGWHTHGG